MHRPRAAAARKRAFRAKSSSSPPKRAAPAPAFRVTASAMTARSDTMKAGTMPFETKRAKNSMTLRNMPARSSSAPCHAGEPETRVNQSRTNMFTKFRASAVAAISPDAQKATLAIIRTRLAIGSASRNSGSMLIPPHRSCTEGARRGYQRPLRAPAILSLPPGTAVSAFRARQAAGRFLYSIPTAA